MKHFRYILWLAVLPAILIIIAWRLSGLLLNDQSALRAEREQLELAAREQADAAAAVEAAARQLHERIEARRTLAGHCVAQALRGLGIEPGSLVPMLFVVQHRGCGEGCNTDEIARQLVNEYHLEGLQVVLIRTEQTDRQQPGPAGVPTVTIPSCVDLVAEQGDDYFLRMTDGSLGSSGERHESALRADSEVGADDMPMSPPFDPEPLVRQGLGLTPRR